MNFTATLNRSTQSLSEFWSARNARERVMLAAAAVVVLFGLVYWVLINPALSGRERLRASLPAMRQQVAQLQALSKEASSLSATAPPSVPTMTRENLEASLARKGLKAQNISVTGENARLQMPSVSFASLLDWMDDAQKTALLSVVDANIVALGQPGIVNATLTLRQRKNE
jgi:general secretion pathway protein M